MFSYVSCGTNVKATKAYPKKCGFRLCVALCFAGDRVQNINVLRVARRIGKIVFCYASRGTDVKKTEVIKNQCVFYFFCCSPSVSARTVNKNQKKRTSCPSLSSSRQYDTNSTEIYRMDREGRGHMLTGMVLMPYEFHGSLQNGP